MLLFKATLITLSLITLLRRISSSELIIGGGPAKKGEFPFMALLLRHGEFVCGGTLISERHVLTAWHCVWPHFASYSVRLGEHDQTEKEETEQEIAVTEIKPHPDINIDMAVLVLEKPAVLNKWVEVAELVQEEPILGWPAIAVGWGWTKSGERSVADILQKVIVPIQSTKACVDDGLTWINETSQICAGFTVFRTYINVCHRDSGSPLIVKEHLVGKPRVVALVQGGHAGCVSDKHMALFTRVVPYKDWIMDNIRTNETEVLDVVEDVIDDGDADNRIE